MSSVSLGLGDSGAPRSPKRARAGAFDASLPRGRDQHPLLHRDAPAGDLFGGFDVAPAGGVPAYDAYPGIKDVLPGHAAAHAAHAAAGTPDGAVGKSFADVFTTPGDLAGGFAGGLPLPLGGAMNPFGLPLMDAQARPGHAADVAGAHAMLNLPPVYTPGSGEQTAAEEAPAEEGGAERRARERFTPTRADPAGPLPMA